MIIITSFYNQSHDISLILNVTAPLYADDGCVPCFLQHLVPFLIISTNPVPESTKENYSLNEYHDDPKIPPPPKRHPVASLPPPSYLLFKIHFLHFFNILLVSFLKLFSCILLLTEGKHLSFSEDALMLQNNLSNLIYY